MPTIRLNKTVPFTPEQMFNLVVDIEHYPDFLPWCVKCRRREVKHDSFVAEMTFAFKGFRESFETLDRLELNRRVRVSLMDGPFHHLENEWSFHPVEGGTRVEFFIDFKFKNKMIDLAFGPVFATASKQMLSAFHQRAMAVYGISG